MTKGIEIEMGDYIARYNGGNNWSMIVDGIAKKTVDVTDGKQIIMEAAYQKRLAQTGIHCGNY